MSFARAVRPLRGVARYCGPPLGSSAVPIPFARLSSTSTWVQSQSVRTSRQSKIGALLGLCILGSTLVWYTTGTVEADTGAARVRFPATSGHLTGERIISLAELEKHTNEGSLWLCIDGAVYDVTEFMTAHPGGANILLQNGGQDVSKLFHAIHPGNTLSRDFPTVRVIGKLDDEAAAKFATNKSDEDKRIEAARAALFGVDSVVSLQDFERYAKDCLPVHAWAYYSTGADTEETMHENADAYSRVSFRPRIMRDVSSIDTTTKILGVPVNIPVYVSPTARNALGQAEGEVAVARGAGAAGILQVLSHYASRSLAEVKAAAAEGQEIGWQLYLSSDREKSAQAVRAAVAAGAQSIWITADTTLLGKREVERRIGAELEPAPNGHPLTRSPVLYANMERNMSWSDIKWVQELAPGLPVVVKGVGAWEDVELAYKAGADAVVLSNHGGRQLNYAQAPLRTLADVNAHAPYLLRKKNFSVFVDGGVRHGTDVLKALCLGAKAVGLGRPFIYAATGWGSEGVERLCMILHEEIEIGMALLGVTRLDQLGPQYVDTSKL